MGLINNNLAYAIKYDGSFPRLARPGIYAPYIDTTKDASLDSRKNEASHKSTIANWEIYDVAKSDANRFIVRIVADVWISPLSMGSPTFYAKRMTKDLPVSSVPGTRNYPKSLLVH